MTNHEAIAARLKEQRARLPDSDTQDGLDSDTISLIKRDPFAFLIAAAFDRGMPWQKAWQIPAEIHREGYLDPKRLAQMSKDDLARLLNRLPIRPRYGVEQGAKTLADCARLVCNQFDGDASAIWKNSSPAEVEKTLQRIHGIGAGIASMTTRMLHEDWGYFKGKEWQIDVKPDIHLLRVFRRTGLIDDESADQARSVARRLNPEFPGALDWPAWRIGQDWCRPKEPKCADCPLTKVCEKRIP